MTCACCEAIFICMDVDIYSWHAGKGRLLFNHIAECTVIRTISDEQIDRPTQCLVALLRAWMCDASNIRLIWILWHFTLGYPVRRAKLYSYLNHHTVRHATHATAQLMFTSLPL